jgi:hypothetical protein
MKAIYSVVAALAFFSSLIVPLSAAEAQSDKNNTTVTHVYSAQDGVLIRLALPMTGEGCTDNSYGIIRFGAAYPNAEQQFGIALSAYLSGRAVNVRLSSCATDTSIGPGTFPVVSFITLIP